MKLPTDALSSDTVSIVATDASNLRRIEGKKMAYRFQRALNKEPEKLLQAILEVVRLKAAHTFNVGTKNHEYLEHAVFAKGVEAIANQLGERKEEDNACYAVAIRALYRYVLASLTQDGYLAGTDTITTLAEFDISPENHPDMIDLCCANGTQVEKWAKTTSGDSIGIDFNPLNALLSEHVCVGCADGSITKLREQINIWRFCRKSTPEEIAKVLCSNSPADGAQKLCEIAKEPCTADVVTCILGASRVASLRTLIENAWRLTRSDGGNLVIVEAMPFDTYDSNLVNGKSFNFALPDCGINNVGKGDKDKDIAGFRDFMETLKDVRNVYIKDTKHTVQLMTKKGMQIETFSCTAFMAEKE